MRSEDSPLRSMARANFSSSPLSGPGLSKSRTHCELQIPSQPCGSTGNVSENGSSVAGTSQLGFR